MRDPLHRIGVLFVFVSAFGCGGPEYVPDITLVQVRSIVDATAEFHGLYAAPGLVSGKDRFGLDASKAERVSPGELTEQIGSELLRELDAAGVFSRITRFDVEPDVIVTGRINALYEHYRPQVWTYIPLPWPGTDVATRVLNLKSHVSSGEADLTLFLLKPNGEVIGRYQGTSRFRETFNPTDEVPPGARLNRALTEAVERIQEKIGRDSQLRNIASQR